MEKLEIKYLVPKVLQRNLKVRCYIQDFYFTVLVLLHFTRKKPILTE